MKLTRLELHGFKSFADRTAFHFDAGTTVVVGPNGCGKSNVVDAFKWVLGEQSAKSLRGDGMQDVIFSGSGERKPAGLAEVVLTFDNSDRRLPVEQAEVCVGRRLFRDGTSEYLLNGQVVRLRDIRELFMDTGIGVDAYSLVEQGKVDQVLASNTVERRAIFEEAAGISKYRSRKRDASRKLERVEQNLLRLTDIITEVDRRLRAIKAAATKARNYQELSVRLRELRVSHFVREYHRLSESLAEVSREVSGAGERVEALTARQGELGLRLSELDDRQLRLAGELAEVENRLVQISSAVANHQDRIRFAADREQELADELARRRQASVGLRRRLGELAGQDRELSRSADELDTAAESARGRIEQIGHDQHAAEVEIGELADQAGRANDALFDLMRTASQLSNQLQQHRAARENLTAQRQRLSARAAQVDAQIDARGGERDRHRAELARLDAELADLNGQLDRARSQAAARDAAIRELGGQLGELKEHRSALAGRRDLLADQERRGEGLSDGPRALLQAQGEYERSVAEASDRVERIPFQSDLGLGPRPEPTPLPHVEGLEGLVADLFLVAPDDDPDRQIVRTGIVQTALGEREQWLVVRRSAALTAEPARRLLDGLPGAATLLCMDRLSPAKPDLSPWRNRPGVIGPLSDLVLCEPVYFGVRDHLLGWTLLVESLDDAVRLAGESLNNSRVRFLTRTGVLVTAEGRVTAPPGGDASAADSPAALGLIGRKAELRELNEQLEELAGRLAELESQLAAESAEAAQLERVVQELRSAGYQRSTERVECAARLRQVEQAIDALHSERALLNSELADLSIRIEQASAGEAAAGEKIEQTETRRRSVQQESDQLAARLSERRAAAESMGRALADARVALGQADERRQAVRQQLAAVRRALEEARAQQATAASDCRSLLTRIEQSQLAQLAGGAAIAELFARRQQTGRQRQRLAGGLEAARTALAETDAQARAVGHELSAAQSALHQAQVAQNELRVRQEDLVQRVADEHQIDLPRLHATSPPPGEGASVDWSAVEAEIADLRGRIERLGSVNVEAIAEQEQLEARSLFLHEQVGDVQRAKDQLEALIERINVESRRRFEQAFVQVREQFRELFRKLFGGGRADLVLENPDDLLESGIEIIARPPGKELRSISLLSGGEKTMTALALLLAIFRSRPSPFCILDEVDAALDEANNERFNQLIREFLEFSQFIIITHSKRTMTIADVLYGVTMQEQGVSRQVAVRFDGKNVRGDDGEDLEERQTAVA